MNKYDIKSYNKLFPCSDIKLGRELYESQSRKDFFELGENGTLVSRPEFKDIKDIDNYINEIISEMGKIKDTLDGTEKQQGLEDRLKELDEELETKKRVFEGLPQEVITSLCKNTQAEYDDLLKLKSELINKYHNLNKTLELLKSARTKWSNYNKEVNQDIIKYYEELLKRLDSAYKELKTLESKTQKGIYDNSRISDLKEIIAYLTKQIPSSLLRKKSKVSYSEDETENLEQGFKNIKPRKDALKNFRGHSAICCQTEASSFANIGNVLLAYSDVGLLRDNNEDSFVLCIHPEFGEFTLGLVADGMGGSEAGEVASKYVAEQLQNWFKSLPVEMYTQPEELKLNLNQKLIEINANIPAGGTTLACIITCENDALVTTIGDSRVYAEKEEELVQVGHDHSIAYLDGINNEDARFYSNNNVLTSGLGVGSFSICQSLIPRSDYIALHAMTDGITDLISEKKLANILINNNHPAEKHNAIIDLANNPQNRDLIKLKWLFNKEYKAFLDAGKDNETIVTCCTGTLSRKR